MNNEKSKNLARLFVERPDVAVEMKKEYFSNKEDKVRNIQLRYLKSLIIATCMSFLMLVYVTILLWFNAAPSNDYWSENNSLIVFMSFAGILLFCLTIIPLSEVKTFKGFYKKEIQNFREDPFDIIKYFRLMNLENSGYPFLLEEEPVNHEDVRKALDIIDVW